MGIIIPLILIAISCLVIWRAGDGFMTASEYIGRNLSEGVRGASINAIASSMPEVFTSIFFLFVLKDASGFSGGIGTTAGSAIFNGMVIPAVSVIAVIGIGLAKRIEVSKKVMLRDGIALIITELIFLILISGSELNWYHGLVLMGVYLVYISYMFLSMKKGETLSSEGEIEEEEENEPKPSFFKSCCTFDLENIFIRRKMSGSNAWSLLLFSTAAIAAVCYLLVVACEWMGADSYEVPFLGTFKGLNIPLMFVALILASAASSFPDTIISIKDAQRGQYDDAISNALGSNIFDVCFALGFPLFLFTIIYGPIHMPPELIDLSSELRLLLLLLTIIIVVIFTATKYIGKTKAFVLLLLYLLFVMYIIGRSAGNEFTNTIAHYLVETVHFFSIK
ncbi:hypothetical protein N6H18_04200 [Reichenbachiella agarivorans]|uniref:Sodium/calcium exchanger membrane region domain-containing protein n=1 Tax=Reichenbachiella agarivorans TaxID=2979464 RepID=A0ABY6CRL1_9BACT|nr:hypothetical protein [Reichenbachiella agarivorans]UXP33155.1 hypothetical protein N6H18_04200 [Reichenbachiella agarivorans]